MTFAMFNISNSSNGVVVADHDIISEKDLEHLLHLLDDKVGDAAWQNQMERTTPNMIYHAWRHEPEVSPTLLTNPSISLTNLINVYLNTLCIILFLYCRILLHSFSCFHHRNFSALVLESHITLLLKFLHNN